MPNFTIPYPIVHEIFGLGFFFTDGRNVTHMSPLCICTGGLINATWLWSEPTCWFHNGHKWYMCKEHWQGFAKFREPSHYTYQHRIIVQLISVKWTHFLTWLPWTLTLKGQPRWHQGASAYQISWPWPLYLSRYELLSSQFWSSKRQTDRRKVTHKAMHIWFVGTHFRR